jgi:hypothetical protein
MQQAFSWKAETVERVLLSDWQQYLMILRPIPLLILELGTFDRTIGVKLFSGFLFRKLWSKLGCKFRHYATLGIFEQDTIGQPAVTPSPARISSCFLFLLGYVCVLRILSRCKAEPRSYARSAP